MKIEILGTGCKKCNDLAANAKKATGKLGIEAEIVKVTDLKQIANYGVMSMPALVVDGTVKSVGKLLSVEEIAELLR